MLERTKPWTLVFTLILAAACAPGGDTPAPAEEETAPAEASSALPPVSVLVGHRVADFDAWKAAFDAHTPARKEATCLGHYLKRGVDDPNVVYIYCLATDVDKLRAFLVSADLAEVMRNAGVEGTPEITVMQPMSRDLVAASKLPGIIVMHRVENYETWRAEYDAFDGFRRQSGIVGHAVSRALDDPNHLVVYHQADDVAEVRAFVDSAELKQAMQRAGVVGEPDIRFIQVVDFATY